jgi:hypothetical protein
MYFLFNVSQETYLVLWHGWANKQFQYYCKNHQTYNVLIKLLINNNTIQIFIIPLLDMSLPR